MKCRLFYVGHLAWRMENDPKFKSLDGRQAKFAESLINYFLRVWVNGSFPPNMFQSSGLTTNNHAEAYNSRLGKSTKLGKHPNFYLWAESIISELKNSSVDAAMAIAGNLNVRPKKS